uniref:Cytochrome c oxidase subunit 2 n=1 Tax=Bovicola caprae TaxID=1647116 RepID=A0A3P8MXH8_9NEOP|nr:cytochrome c oxidase subunit II [Bovicola caprae]
MSSWGQKMMLDSNSVSMHLIDSVHDWILFVLAIVISVVFSWMSSLYLSGFTINRFLLSHETLEVVWSLTPLLLLGGLMGPSLSSLYSSDDSSSPAMTLKVTGNQWFWSYEYPDLPLESHSSYMSPLWDLGGGFRNLEVDNSTVLPSGTPVRVIVSSEDVAHSWAVPSLGVKMDAIPGRLNEVSLYSGKCGVMYGQCSEICGSLHSFMPVKLEVVSIQSFLKLLN